MIRTEQNVVAKPNGIVAFNVNSLPAMIDRAVRQLASATTSAEVLEARDVASVVYDAAKKAARLAKAKGAHDDLIAKAHRAQADALEIEAAAKRRLADEYDAAQERGEIAKAGNPNFSTTEKLQSGPELVPPKDLHEAREVRDAEEADPGIIRRAPSALEKFRVRVTAGAETEIAINKIVTWLGYRVEAGSTPGSIRAVGALTNIYKSFGIDVLKEALVSIKGTWADDNGAVEGPIIEGFAGLIGQHRGHLDWTRLREKTAASFTPGRLLGHAKSDRDVYGGRLGDGIRRVLIRNYNQGLRTGKLSD